MNIVQTNQFKKDVKKLHSNQKRDLDDAVIAIVHAPEISQSKTGDLNGVLVYKFKMVNQLTLLAYTHNEHTNTLALLALVTHELKISKLREQLQIGIDQINQAKGKTIESKSELHTMFDHIKN
jgi:mRNA-degrading endonuclease YafQ of YafQ-DinJ toxin-antitoxin module